MSIVLEQITKRFGAQWVVDHVSLEVSDGELFVLLGSSGSGKSTILRIIAGLTQPTSGRVLLHGRDVTHLPPQKRGTGFVFQNYSIFRHMTVGDNIEFGLKIRRTPRSSRRRKRDELLDLVGLAGLGHRYAHQLSGGQQQRVALARALAYEPDVLLLDEPFGALDVKIRAQLRRSLKEIQQRLKVTTILVTHDQEEAFELADRIGVLERGRLLEVGHGESLYSQPRSLFAATFLGAGTVLVGRARDGVGKFGPVELPIPPDSPHEEGARVQLLFRPEQVVVSANAPPEEGPVIGKGKIVEQSFAGPLRRLRLRLARPEGARQIAPGLPFGDDALLVDVALRSEEPLDADELWVGLRGWTILEQPAPRVLVYDNGRGAATGLKIGTVLANAWQAEITVLTVASDGDGARKLRESMKGRCRDVGIEHCEIRIRTGDISEQILFEQAEGIYDMLIWGSRARDRGRRLPGRERRLSSRLEAVLRQAEIPVLVVEGERTEISRILICTAAGEPGKNDVRVGGQLARMLGARVTLLYITRPSDPIDSLTRAHLDRAIATLRAMDIQGEVRTREAPTASAGILAEAQDLKSDIIILGAHIRRSRGFFNIADVTAQVLAGADRPVLVVPSEKG